MKFDVVIGNPPYNNDIYLDFVNLAMKLSNITVCMITPTKHYFLNKPEYYSELNKNMLKYTDRLIFYQCEGEVFNIFLPSGVGYYLIGKTKSDTMLVKNESNHFDSFKNDWEQINISDGTFNIKALHIIKKVKPNGLNIESLNKNKNCKVYSRKHCYAQGGSSNDSRGVFYYDNKFVPGFITVSVITTSDNEEDIGTAKCIASFDTIDELNSFVSYINTRLVRYLINARLSAYSNIFINEVWKFVPDPVNFDHIFTDQELYQKYNLTPDEIEIIESVIKERK